MLSLSKQRPRWPHPSISSPSSSSFFSFSFLRRAIVFLSSQRSEPRDLSSANRLSVTVPCGLGENVECSTPPASLLNATQTPAATVPSLGELLIVRFAVGQMMRLSLSLLSSLLAWKACQSFALHAWVESR
ncbi:hypothetical protein IE53DRAFT_30539 [Violaceomyces palustris]|uniref:Uncharacterized protein n=1 Tax=Violaceomyces palustris TaxID=1673888 RepID=A0ACD0P178_9BASI|nr:hypothetical protein IE53DRAFT_30539 [Violaceomyces palustris]